MANIDQKLKVIKIMLQDKAGFEYRDELEAGKNGQDKLAARHQGFREGLYYAEQLVCFLEPTED